MLKMEYFNLRQLLGVLRSKQVSGRWKHHSVYSVNVRGYRVASNCLQDGGVLPPGASCPRSRVHFFNLSSGNQAELP